MRERNYRNIFKTERNLKQIAILGIIFLLILIGGKTRVFGAALIVVLSCLGMLNWRYLFYLGLVLTPIKVIWLTNAGFNLQLNHIVLVGAILGALFDKKSGLFIESGKFEFRILIGLCVLLISSFQSVYIPADPLVILGAVRNYPWIKSLGRVLFVVFLVCIALFVKSFIRDKKRLISVLRCLFFSSAVYSLIGLFCFVLFFFIPNNWIVKLIIISSGDEFQRIKVFEWEPLFFGSYLLTIVPLVFSAVFSNNTAIMNKKLLRYICAADVLALFFTFSRGVWAGFLVAMAFLILNQQRNFFQFIAVFLRAKLVQAFECIKKNYVKSTIVCFSSVILLFFMRKSLKSFFFYLVYYPIVGAVSPHTGKFWSTKLRLLTIDQGLNAFYSHPFFGIGYENFSFYSGNTFIPGFLGQFFAINHPEINSLPFKILIETGSIGFLVIFLLLAKSMWELLNLLKKTKSTKNAFILRGVIGCVIGVGVNSVFFSNVSSTYLWVLLGILLSLINTTNKK